MLSNIGVVYFEQKKYYEALDYYQRSLKIDEEINDKSGISTCMLNIGEVYQFLNKPYIKTNIMRKKIILLAGIIMVGCFLSDAMAQPRDSTRTTTGGPGGAARTGPKPYKEIITDKAISRSGFFKVHKVDEKYFFELPDDLLTRDILVVSRISKAAAGMRSGGFFGYAGDQIGQNVVRFEIPHPY